MNMTIKWSMHRLADGSFRGVVVLPTGPKGLAVRAKAKTKEDALHRAAVVAQAVADNPLVSAALPPGTAVAVKAIGFLAKSSAAGVLGDAMKKVTGEGAKRLADALKFW